MFTLYNKAEMADLTPKERRAFAEAERLKAELEQHKRPPLTVLTPRWPVQGRARGAIAAAFRNSAARIQQLAEHGQGQIAGDFGFQAQQRIGTRHAEVDRGDRETMPGRRHGEAIA